MVSIEAVVLAEHLAGGPVIPHSGPRPLRLGAQSWRLTTPRASQRSSAVNPMESPDVNEQSQKNSGAMSAKAVTKAVIPLAGKGTRLRPMTSVVPKALFPVVDPRRGVRAVLHVLLEEVCDAGIEDVCLVVSPEQDEAIREYLAAARPSYQTVLPSRICLVEQSEPEGFGHAVLQARAFVDGEPFVLLLGDHVHVTKSSGLSCIGQVLGAFERQGGKAMIGVHDVDERVIHTVGVATGTLVEQRTLRCTDFVEKPSRQVAEARLRSPELPRGRFFGHCGIYVFDATIFEYLDQERQSVGTCGKEIELAAAQLRLMHTFPDAYFLYWIDGRACDMGTPEGYRDTFAVISGLVAYE
jgi:UTP--glucose-1-phosphate uridylyltransferase